MFPVRSIRQFDIGFNSHVTTAPTTTEAFWPMPRTPQPQRRRFRQARQQPKLRLFFARQKIKHIICLLLKHMICLLKYSQLVTRMYIRVSTSVLHGEFFPTVYRYPLLSSTGSFSARNGKPPVEAGPPGKTWHKCKYLYYPARARWFRRIECFSALY